MVAPSIIKRGGGKYCSNTCKGLFNWGKPEYQKHMSDAHKGQIPTNLAELIAFSKSPEGRKFNSERQRGREPWNKGKVGVQAAWNKNLTYSFKRNLEAGPSYDKKGYRMVLGNSKKREHRQVMEDAIGRTLTKKEVVHHWDKVKTNNQKENLCLFRSQSPHKRLHHFADRHGIEIKQFRFAQPWLMPNA